MHDNFVENLELSGWSVKTDTGWQPITHTNKTVMFDVWEVITEDGMSLKCADDHIVFTTDHNEVFVKDLYVGQLIATENGWSAIKSVVKTDRSEHMYDLSVDSPDHRYYTNGILSHNTAVVAAILLHYTLFNDAKVVAILANKESQAKEIVSRIRQMYEYLPFFLQQGAVSYNKKSVVFENRSEIFCAATGNESVRGRSCVVGDTSVKVRDKGTGEVRSMGVGELASTLTVGRIASYSNGQTFISNDCFEVWTPDGWSDFDGVVINHDRPTISLVDHNLSCTPCHLIRDDAGDFIRADTTPHQEAGVCDVYDLFNVHKANQYFTNDVVSHNCSVIYIDEAAFIANDNEFYESTYPVISSGEQTKIIMTSTPKGRRGMFFNLFEGADEDVSKSKNGYKKLLFTWKSDPRKNEAWKKTTIERFGVARFMQEFECVFRGSSGTLISPTILQDLAFINPINDDPHLSIYRRYEEGHSYVAYVDTGEGLGGDYSVVTVIDVSTVLHEVVCVYRNNTISPIVFPHTIVSVCRSYGSCPVLIETNNTSGGQVSYGLYYDIEYENVIMTSQSKQNTAAAESGSVKPGVKTSKLTKRVGCSNLNTLIETGNIVINDATILEELGTFIAKGASYEADKDCHDDVVMTLVLHAWYITQDNFSELAGNNIKQHIYDQAVNAALSQVLPFGFASNNAPPVVEDRMQMKVTSTGNISDWLSQ